MVRPHLEFEFQVWSLFHEGDITTLEKVQRRAKKVHNTFKNMEYSNILEAFKLKTLEKRKTHGDLIYMFKVAKGTEDIDLKMSHDLNEHKTRDHKYRFSKEILSATKSNDFTRIFTIRHIFFLNRVAPLWNILMSL